MTKTLFLFLLLFALGAPQVIPQTPAAQPPEFGTIQGTVVREGTAEPIPDVQITLAGSAGITAQEAQVILNAQARGGVIASSLPPEVLQMAQDAARGGSAALTAVSNSEGQFTIRNVPAGTTTLRAQLEGYFGRAVNGQYIPGVSMPITVAADQTLNIKIPMLPGGTLTGRVLDSSGKPVPDAPVQIMLMGYLNGVPTPQTADIKQTDDRGEYRMYRLQPGEYYVAASPRPQAALLARGNVGLNPQEVQVPTYYPNVTDIATAARIALHSGDELAGINIQMRTVPSVKVSGRVTGIVPPGITTGPRGEARTGGVMLVPTSARGLVDLNPGGVVTLNADGGTFEFQNVAPGAYDVIARLSVAAGAGWGPQAPPATATGPWALGRVGVDVRNANIENVAVVVRTGVDLKGHVLLDGMRTRANVRVSVQPDDSAQNLNDQQLRLMFNQIRQYQPPIGDDGSFTIPLLPAGRYRFQVQLNAPSAPARGARGTAAALPEGPPPPALPAGAYLADIRQGGTSVYDNGLVVGTEQANPIEVLLSTSPGSIEGTVANPDQKPVAAITVVLIPPDNRRQNSALYRITSSDSQGRFRMTNLPPGRYTLYAWESVPAGAYQNAEFMARYVGRGTSVTVDAGGRTTATVNAIREDSSGR